MEESGEESGDIGVRGIWNLGKECIIDVCITNLDCKSNITSPHLKFLLRQEQDKKRKYLTSIQEQRKDFTPFVASVDGLLSQEAL